MLCRLLLLPLILVLLVSLMPPAAVLPLPIVEDVPAGPLDVPPVPIVDADVPPTLALPAVPPVAADPEAPTDAPPLPTDEALCAIAAETRPALSAPANA